MPPCLCDATSRDLPTTVVQPTYDRHTLETGIVHLGLGNFARGHVLAVFDALAAAGDRRCGVIGVSLRSPAMRDRLSPQDGLYTLREREADGTARTRLIGVLREVLVAPEDPGAVLRALAAPATVLVTLTITEQGYGLRRATGTLDQDDPDVAHDLAHPDAPRTAPGFLAAALAERLRQDRPRLAILSCDNLPENGVGLRRAVEATLRHRDPALADRLDAAATFPSTMVDRIVPATEASDLDAAEARLGLRDAGALDTEAFLQWVIEGRFPASRPEFERVSGVTLTASVAPWEEAKLRLLNGAHSAIAYLGGLHDLVFVHEVVATPEGRRLVDALWDEAAATLDPPPGLDLSAYRAALMRRFADPAARHRTEQIAVDGSRKLPQRLLAPIAARLAAGTSVQALGLAVAGWMRWQSGRSRSGRLFAVRDPLAERTARLLAASRDEAEAVAALLSLREVFPAALAADAEFVRSLRQQYIGLGNENLSLAAVIDAALEPR